MALGTVCVTVIDYYTISCDWKEPHLLLLIQMMLMCLFYY